MELSYFSTHDDFHLSRSHACLNSSVKGWKPARLACIFALHNFKEHMLITYSWFLMCEGTLDLSYGLCMSLHVPLVVEYHVSVDMYLQQAYWGQQGETQWPTLCIEFALVDSTMIRSWCIMVSCSCKAYNSSQCWFCKSFRTLTNLFYKSAKAFWTFSSLFGRIDSIWTFSSSREDEYISQYIDIIV